jgi:hypothetical protein
MDLSSNAALVVAALGPTLAAAGNALMTARFAKQAVAEAKRAREERAEAAAVARSTHTIVNNQREGMLRAILALAERVARGNPGDATAQTAATDARANLAAATRLISET